MVDIGICLEDYEEGDLEQHLEMCVLRLMFRCSLCDADYVSKEGLWNHLDLHEIEGDCKELQWQEIKTKYKLHQCVLCNDQRAYSESSYWKHVHDIHDGFFLRCSDCGENFRSEKLKNDHDHDHALSHHKERDETVASGFNALENKTLDADHLKISQEEQSSNENEELNDRLSEHSPDDLNTASDVDRRFTCDICGQSCSSKGLLLRHKAAKYKCVKGKLGHLSSSSSGTKCFHGDKECARLNCPKHAKEHDSQFHDVKEAEGDPTGFPQGENSIIKLEIDVEETIVQEQEHQVPNENPERSSSTTLNSGMMFRPAIEIELGYVPIKTCSFEDALSLVKKFEHGFAFRSKHNSENGIMRYYRCTRVKQRIRPQCDRRVLIWSPNIDEKPAVYTKGQHTCLNVPPENVSDAYIDYGYVPLKTCSFEEATSFVKSFEYGFAHRVETVRAKGTMRFYRCLRIKCKARPQCERKVLIFTPNINGTSTVCAKGEHSCINAPPEILANAEVHDGYVPHKTCSFEDEKSFVKNFEFGFAFREENVTEKGSMRYYRCTSDKKNVGPECERKLLIFTPNVNETTTVCVRGEHSCSNDPPKKFKRERKIDFGSVQIKTCSFEDAKSFVKNFEFGFVYRSNKIREDGIMRYYCCPRIKQRVRPQCERKVLIFTASTNQESTVYTQGEHSCIHAPPEYLIHTRKCTRIDAAQIKNVIDEQ